MMQNYIIRHATIEDLDKIAELEATCFPKEEAATRDAFSHRLKAYPKCFWLLITDNKIVSMVNGMVSDIPILVDEMYRDSTMHDSMGEWQMIFGVETRREYRRKGYGITVDIEPEHEMEKVLYTVDELTGLIGAVAIMRPSKSVQELELKSVKKKCKSKNFAAGCSREVIERGAKMLRWELDDLIVQTSETI